MSYPATLREEEIKNKVAADVFGAYDCTRIFGAIDFCVAARVEGPTLWETESLLWAEAKAGVRADLAPLFAQLVLTIGREKTHEKHSPPPFLGAFDCEKIAFLPYHAVVDFFAVNDFDWTVTPSDTRTREFNLLLDRIRPLLAAQGVVFRFDEARELAAFLRKNLRTGPGATDGLPVTRNNFVFVWNRWREAVMPTIAVDWAAAKRRGILDADFFLADLLSKDNSTLVEKLYVVLRGNHYELDRSLDEMGLFVSKRAEFKDGQAAHAAFWNRYRRPPRREFWHWIAERRDLLVPQDVRERKGSFFTPRIWVEKAQEALAAVLGEDWQDEYDVWDCAAGTGNLLAGLSDKYRIWASTLDQADVDVMHERIKNGANLLDSHVFRFDFLNGSFDDLPGGLRQIVQDPERRRKLVVFINPPYKEATNVKQKTGTGGNITGLTKGTSSYGKYLPAIGMAARELFAQFLYRIATEIPGCTIGQFSKLKHLQAQNFRTFRQKFRGRLCKSFLVPASTFDNVKGTFPIGFFVWQMDGRQVFSECEADVYDAKGNPQGTKHIHSYDSDRFVIEWLRQFYDKESERIGYLVMVGTDVQHSNNIFITSKPSQNDFLKHTYTVVTSRNLIPMCIYMAIRHVIEATWLNDRDQFLWPADTWKNDLEFQTNCLVWALFDNVVKSADGVNHWIPFAESEVGAKDAYRSRFMVDYLRGKAAGGTPALPAQADLFGTALPLVAEARPSYGALTPTPEARAVLDAGRELWRYYHAQPGAVPDASFYDIRGHFQGFKPNGHMNPDSPDAEYTRLISALRDAQKRLAARIAPKVRLHGFLR